MNDKKHKQFMYDQIEEIKRFKQEREKEVGRILNDDIVHKWIFEQSSIFRKKWEDKHAS